MTDYIIRVLGGLPALARVTAYVPFVPATWTAPAEGHEVEFEILDRGGRRAPWLERRLMPKDLAGIEGDLLKRCFDEWRTK
jgi:hypothetical protein